MPYIRTMPYHVHAQCMLRVCNCPGLNKRHKLHLKMHACHQKGKLRKQILNRKENTCLQSLDQRCEASHSRCVVANAIGTPLPKDQGPTKQQRISCSHGHCKHRAGHGKWQKGFLFIFDCLLFVENVLPDRFNLHRQICCPLVAESFSC